MIRLVKIHEILRALVLGFVLLLVTGWAQALAEDAPLRRGSWAAFKEETDVLAANDSVIRKAEAGEVIRIRIVRDGWAEVGSSLPDLAGGKVNVASLRASNEEENEAWLAKGRERIATAAKEAEPLNPNPPADEEAKIEAAEAPSGPLPAPVVPPSPEVREVVLGWFSPARSVRVASMVRGGDGAVYLSGKVQPPVNLPGAKGWNGAPLPAPNPETPDAELAFLARIAPDLKSIPDFFVFAPEELAAVGRLVVPPSGEGVWAVVEGAGESIGGKVAAKAGRALIHFSPDLATITRFLPILANPQDFVVDSANRPIVLESSPKSRRGGALLMRYFSSGHYERMWPGAPDGPARRMKIDFSSPALAEGPFAIWAKKSEKLPDFPTPLGDWGSEPDAGEQIPWTNVKSGKNPIGGANLVPEAVILDREGNIYLCGTIPFNMGFPDFDPFLLKFSPDGKFIWNNCFLNGLLSEPDQKTQAVALDPSNGDLIISYWQHGNNRKTLLLAPNGWLTKFTGTNGNIKITWIGRVDPATGKLKNSTYIHSQMPNSPNPRWPDLNSAGLTSLAANSKGWVFAAGGTTISFPTTINAFLPIVSEYGGHPYLAVLEPDLSAPRYSTYLSAGSGGVEHMALCGDRTAVLVGTHKTTPPGLATAGPVKDFPYLSDTPPADKEEGVFLSIFPIPEEVADWSFNN